MVMRVGVFGVALALGAALAGPVRAAGPGGAAEATAAVSTATAPALTGNPAAIALVKRMAGFVAGLQRFEVTVGASWDEIQETGERIEFSAIRQILANRPSGLAVDALESTGRDTGIRFDGKTLTLIDRSENVYAELPLAGTADDALRYLVGPLQARLPLALLFLTSLPEEVGRRGRSIELVQRDALYGVPVDHIAVRADSVDVQVWIEEGEQPLPYRVIITYRDEPGAPQFRADLTDWDLEPDVSPERFAPALAQGAERIPFMVRVDGVMPQSGAATEQTGAKQ